MPYLRDFAIALKAFCFFTDETDKGERDFRHEVFRWADNNIPVMGWSDDEIGFVDDCSKYDKFVIPMDWSSNTSYFVGARTGKKLKQVAKCETIVPKPGEHYLAICVSDGDNIQWLSRFFATSSLFGQELNKTKKYKMSWTFPPYMCRIVPTCCDYIYSIATPLDSFIAGVSGAAYINCTTYPDEHLTPFTDLSARLMKECDIDTVTLLDNMDYLSDKELTDRKLANYTRHKGIIGGVWELDPGRYERGKGEVYTHDGKPFLSVRMSLWHPSDQPDNITAQWLDEKIDIINSYKCDPTSKEGYTVLNIHPWTMTMKDLDYVVGRLSKHIKIVSVPELVTMYAKNVT